MLSVKHVIAVELDLAVETMFTNDVSSNLPNSLGQVCVIEISYEKSCESALIVVV